nr:MAG TPA: hypothetical protein [Caudoviricetes sp.]
MSAWILSSLCSCCRFRYPCKRLFDVLQPLICLHVHLSTVIIELILGIFTGFIMVSGYCIMSRFTVL